MPIAVECASCGSKLKAPDNAAGRKVKCPKCGNPIAVPADQSAPPADFPPPVKQPPARKPAVPAAVEEAEEAEEAEEVPEEEEDFEDLPAQKKGGKKSRKGGKKDLPRLSPVSAFGYFMCCVGGIWTIITYFQLCAAVNSIDRKANLQGWTIFIPIYSLIYLGTVIEALNQIIDDNGLDVEPLSNNIVLNLLIPFIPLYQMFSKYNEVADAL